MNLSKQIKYFRKRDHMSQEELAEKIYVSRQSISNWENERSYPDIHNLLMLSVLFNVSLDELVKGDVETMKRELEQSTFVKLSSIMTALMVVFLISIAPAMYFFGNYGLVIPVVLYIMLLFVTMKVEKIKKEHNLKTYRQIVDFIEGKPVIEVEPSKFATFKKVGFIVVSALFSFIVVYVGLSVLGV